jgi:hypothetical protein
LLVFAIMTVTIDQIAEGKIFRIKPFEDWCGGGWPLRLRRVRSYKPGDDSLVTEYVMDDGRGGRREQWTVDIFMRRASEVVQ